MLILVLQTLGLCITVSGVRRSSDTWNTSAAYTSNALLMTAFAPYIIINAAAQLWTHHPRDEQIILSRGVCIVLLALYCLNKLFRKTHSNRFQRGTRADSSPRMMRKIESSVATALLLCTILVTNICAAPILKAITIDKDSLTRIEPFNVPSREFFGFCLLPVLAELGELSKTCSLSYRGEMDISFEVAATTSIQMMLLVAPLLCLCAWCMGKSLDLNLGNMEGIVLSLNIWVFSIVTWLGRSCYFHGVLVYGL